RNTYRESGDVAVAERNGPMGPHGLADHRGLAHDPTAADDPVDLTLPVSHLEATRDDEVHVVDGITDPIEDVSSRDPAPSGHGVQRGQLGVSLYPEPRAQHWSELGALQARLSGS